MRLGPAGYSFETYIGELLKEQGHQVMLRQMVRGLCVEHEIDVISEERAGSHRQYNHSTKQGRVTIAGHPSHELAPGTLNSILKQAQIKKKR